MRFAYLIEKFSYSSYYSNPDCIIAFAQFQSHNTFSLSSIGFSYDPNIELISAFYNRENEFQMQLRIHNFETIMAGEILLFSGGLEVSLSPPRTNDYFN